MESVNFYLMTTMKPLGAPNVIGTLIGLMLVGIGTGGIKPCVRAFGGDQFKIGQKKYLDKFFSLFYLSINVGSFLGSLITPVLRSDVKCFNSDCYALAFGVPTILFLISIFIFISGKKFYFIKHVDRNNCLFKNIFTCIFYAIKTNFKNRKKLIMQTHWLDHAIDKYDVGFINDVKLLTRTSFMFLPLPIFWALVDQQGEYILEINLNFF